jgi:hypothetical protein
MSSEDFTAEAAKRLTPLWIHRIISFLSFSERNESFGLYPKKSILLFG